MTYLHDKLVEDKQKVGLLAHERAHDILVVGGIQLLVRRLRQSADECVDKQLESLNNHLVTVGGHLTLCLCANDLFNLTFGQVKVDFCSDQLLGLSQALINRRNCFKHHVEVHGSVDQ